MRAFFKIENCGDIIICDSSSYSDAPFLIANNVKSLTLKRNTTNSSETPYIIEDCDSITAHGNIDNFNGRSIQNIKKSPYSFRYSQCYLFIVSVLYGQIK